MIHFDRWPTIAKVYFIIAVLCFVAAVAMIPIYWYMLHYKYIAYNVVMLNISIIAWFAFRLVLWWEGE